MDSEDEPEARPADGVKKSRPAASIYGVPNPVFDRLREIQAKMGHALAQVDPHIDGPDGLRGEGPAGEADALPEA